MYMCMSLVAHLPAPQPSGRRFSSPRVRLTTHIVHTHRYTHTLRKFRRLVVVVRPWSSSSSSSLSSSSPISCTIDNFVCVCVLSPVGGHQVCVTSRTRPLRFVHFSLTTNSEPERTLYARALSLSLSLSLLCSLRVHFCACRPVHSSV